MQTGTSTHPSPIQLAEFAAGKMADAQAEAVARHLDVCSACSNIVHALPPDSLTGRLQGAKRVYRPAPTLSWDGSAPSGLGAPLPPEDTGLPLDVPTQLAEHPKFRILRQLGRGGMGVVYLAEHPIMERKVAIKVVNKAFLKNAEALQRFHAEVRSAAKLGHPNIVQAFDAEQAGDLHFLVMEFVEGKNLAESLEKRQKPLPILHASNYVLQAARGLQHAFERNMVHRDIKPHNLMINLKGQIKILDFGLARMVRERTAQSGGLTSADSFMGTPEYVAPEQAADARQADTRADLYSLGCTLYYLLADRPPFREETAMKVVMAHMQNTPRPLPELRPDVPVALWGIVQKLLAKEPGQRYQTPQELVRALTPFARDGSSASPPKSLEPALSSPARGTQRKIETSKVAKARPTMVEQLPTAAEKERNSLADAPEPMEKKNLRPLLIACSIVLLLFGCLATAIVIYFKTDYGTVVLKIDPADAGDVQITQDGNAINVEFADGMSVPIKLRTGKYTFGSRKKGTDLDSVTVTIQRGQKDVSVPLGTSAKSSLDNSESASSPIVLDGKGGAPGNPDENRNRNSHNAKTSELGDSQQPGTSAKKSPSESGTQNGILRKGAVLKGPYTFGGDFNSNVTMTVTARDDDRFEGIMVFEEPQMEMAFDGRIDASGNISWKVNGGFKENAIPIPRPQWLSSTIKGSISSDTIHAYGTFYFGNRAIVGEFELTITR